MSWVFLLVASTVPPYREWGGGAKLLFISGLVSSEIPLTKDGLFYFALKKKLPPRDTSQGVSTGFQHGPTVFRENTAVQETLLENKMQDVQMGLLL